MQTNRLLPLPPFRVVKAVVMWSTCLLSAARTGWMDARKLGQPFLVDGRHNLHEALRRLDDFVVDHVAARGYPREEHRRRVSVEHLWHVSDHEQMRGG